MSLSGPVRDILIIFMSENIVDEDARILRIKFWRAQPMGDERSIIKEHLPRELILVRVGIRTRRDSWKGFACPCFCLP